ncbi:MAG: FAD:protein FMN transferase [Halieaceae bacterium]
MIEDAQGITQSFKIMGGPARVTINSVHHSAHAIKIAIDQVMSRLLALEARYSRFKPDSLISQINARAGTGVLTPIDLETQSLIDLSDQLWRETNGLFDPTVGVLNQLWDFRTGRATTHVQLVDLLEKVGWDRVEIYESGIRLPEAGMEIDFGGLVKEFAADAAASILREAGFQSALIELAGDIVAIGIDSHDGPWKVGIRDPRGPANSIVSVKLTNAAVCSSGNYARRFYHKGKFVSHLLHPRTGQPIDGPCSVTVVGESALIAGALATVGCLQDEVHAESWLRQSGLPWLMIDKKNQCYGPLGYSPSKPS